MENKNSIDNLFSSLKEAAHQPEPDLWDHIEYDLDRHGFSAVINKFASYSVFRMAMVLTAVLFLLVSTQPWQSTPGGFDFFASADSDYTAVFPDFNPESEWSEDLIASLQTKNRGGQNPHVLNGHLASAELAGTLKSSAVTAMVAKTNDKIYTSALAEQHLRNPDLTTAFVAGASTPPDDPDNFYNAEIIPVSDLPDAAQASLASIEDDPATMQQDVRLANVIADIENASPLSVGSLYGGINISLNHTALLSEFRTDISDENLDQGFSLGHSYGFTLGYQVSDRMAIETGIILDSRQGSIFDSEVLQRQEAVAVTKRIDLHYTQIPLVMRFQHVYQNAFGKHPAVLNYVAGAQYGLLRTSSFSLEDKHVSPQRNLQIHDFAFLLGSEYDLYLTNDLFMSLGVRGSISANQTQLTDVDGINKDKRNVVIGLRAGLNYTLPSFQ